MKLKKAIVLGVISAMMSANVATAVFADESATRGYVADYLLNAADYYNESLRRTDIIKGYDDGLLHEEKGVTRVEALVMLKRAFGEIPQSIGHNKRTAFPAETFDDVPDWAIEELDDVFSSGIVCGKEDGIFAPNEPVTKEQLELFCRRMYALFATNAKDDFYATINKDFLEKTEIGPGRVSAGVMSEMSEKSSEEVFELIESLAEKKNKKGTPEQKLADLYKNILDREAREKQGFTPIQGYIDEIDKINSLDGMKSFETKVRKDLAVNLFAGFALSADANDSTKYSLQLVFTTPGMTKDFYAQEDKKQQDLYIEYLKNVFILGGESEEKAEIGSRLVYEFEKRISEKTLNPQDYGDVDKIYNKYCFDELAEKLDNMDLYKILREDGLQKEEFVIVSDVALMEEIVKCYTDNNIEMLKAVAKYELISSFGTVLSYEYIDLANEFNNEYFGISGGYTDEETAIAILENLMPEYIGKLYVQAHFSEKAKSDVTEMIKDMIEVYDTRIDNLTWMSESTKRKAKEKLAAMNIKVGYPNKWDTYMDNVDIKSKEEGGSYFENILAIAKGAADFGISVQGQAVDKDIWAMPAYMVNACYNPTANDITFPAAILQAPMYDVNVSYEQNLGGIGYVIAHEITHAFDNGGAKFDKNGNATDWWTEEDYEQFQKLCDEMVEFYDGEESVPGIAQSGEQTLSENIADMGAIACITDVASRLKNPDYKVLYTQVAKCWASTSGREFMTYLSQMDTHSFDKLRVNKTVICCDEFYNAFDIDENDGMYIAPEERVKIW